MGETLIVESAQLGATVFVVIVFIGFLAWIAKLFTGTLHGIGEECHSVQRECRVALDRNTQVFGELTESNRALRASNDRLIDHLTSMERRLEEKLNGD